MVTELLSSLKIQGNTLSMVVEVVMNRRTCRIARALFKLMQIIKILPIRNSSRTANAAVTTSLLKLQGNTLSMVVEVFKDTRTCRIAHGLFKLMQIIKILQIRISFRTANEAVTTSLLKLQGVYGSKSLWIDERGLLLVDSLKKKIRRFFICCLGRKISECAYYIQY